jgi:hypothetical protein
MAAPAASVLWITAALAAVSRFSFVDFISSSMYYSFSSVDYSCPGSPISLHFDVLQLLLQLQFCGLQLPLQLCLASFPCIMAALAASVVWITAALAAESRFISMYYGCSSSSRYCG